MERVEVRVIRPEVARVADDRKDPRAPRVVGRTIPVDPLERSIEEISMGWSSIIKDRK